MEINRKEFAASNPGNLEVSLVKYFLCFPLWPSVFVLCCLAGAVVVALWPSSWTGGIALAPILLAWAQWGATKNSFRKGCVCAGVVVSTDPYLIAVLSNLRFSPDVPERNVIKILPQPLARMTGGPPDPETRLATIAMFQMSPTEQDKASGYFIDFHPKVVNCVTYNQKDIDRVLGSIPVEEWNDLDCGLKEVPRPYQPGLYPRKGDERKN
jgi:hypothetical protein